MTHYIRSIKRVFECFLICATLGFSAPAQTPNTIKVVVFGDSLTAGYKLPPEDSYAAKLDKKLREMGYVNVNVINLSIVGETSSGGLQRISSVLVKEPDVVVLELGANDVLRGTNPKLIYSNLGNIIKRLQEKNIYIVMLGVEAPPNLGAEYVAHVESVYRTLATTFKIPFYPSLLDGIYGKPELNLADAYHPNGKGIEVMVENTYRLIDTGVRWRYDVKRREQEYLNNWQLQNSGG